MILIVTAGERVDSDRRSFLVPDPAAMVLSLEIDGRTINQNLIIIEFLDALSPDPRLLPDFAAECFNIMASVYAIACDIHPLKKCASCNIWKTEVG